MEQHHKIPEILFLGSAISDETADEILAKSSVKPSVAPVNFQRNLLRGMPAQNLTVFSLPPVATYPHGAFLSWGARKDNVLPDVVAAYIPTVNLPGLKQLSAFLCTFLKCCWWLWKKRKNKQKIILVYGGYLFTQLAAQWAGKLFKTKLCCIVTDPIRDEVYLSRSRGLRHLLMRTMWRFSEAIRGGFHGYVCLTEALVDLYAAKNKPHLLVEGIADPHTFDGIPAQQKEAPPVIMYAGALSNGFGIPALLEAVYNLDAPCQLWLFGGKGECQDLIDEYERKDARIKYWGKVPRYDLLCAMKKASVLVSVKTIEADRSQYQFPSKIMEYASSGTLIAATQVAGIPEEYFTHLIPMESDTPEGVKNSLQKILAMTYEERITRGEETKNWIEGTKNSHIQAQRILKLLQQICGEEKNEKAGL